MKNVREYEPFFGDWKICADLDKTGNGGRYIIKNKGTGEISILNHISIPRDESYMNAAKRWVPQDGDIEEYFEKNKNLVLDEINFGISLSRCKNIFGTYECDVRKRELEIGWDIFLRLEDPKQVTEYKDANDVVKMGIDICTALEFCLENNIRHGNISPDAIYVNDQGDYKLGRFKYYKDGMKINKYYAAPEVINKEESDMRADIYSLGIVMYKYLNGNALPFVMPGEKNEMVIRQASMDRIKGKRMVNPSNADSTLGRMILKACRLEIEGRYATPSEFKKDLLSVWKEPKAKDAEKDFDEAEMLVKKMLAEDTVLAEDVVLDDVKADEPKKTDPFDEPKKTDVQTENAGHEDQGKKISYFNPFNPTAGIEIVYVDKKTGMETEDQEKEADVQTDTAKKETDVQTDAIKKEADVQTDTVKKTSVLEESLIDIEDEDKLLSEIGEMLKLEGLTD